MASALIWETHVGNAKGALAVRSRCSDRSRCTLRGRCGPALHVGGAGEGHCRG